MPRELPILFCTEMIEAFLDGRKTQTRRIEGLKVLSEHPSWWKFLGWTNPKHGVEARFYNSRQRKSEAIKPRYQVGDHLYAKEALWVSDCGEYYAYGGGFEHSDVIRISDQRLYHAGDCENEEGKPRHQFMVTSYSNRDRGKRHAFTLWCGEYDTSKTIETFTGNTEISSVDVLFSKRKSSRFMPKWAARIWREVAAIKDPHRLQDISPEECIAEGIEVSTAHGEPAYYLYDERLHYTPSPVESFQTLWDRLHPEPGERWGDNPWVLPYVLKIQEKPI